MSRRKRSSAVEFLKLIAFFGAIALLSALFAGFASQTLSDKARILDGDSLIVSGQEIRLVGIDAPEYDQTCRKKEDGSTFACGRQARAHLLRLIGGKSVTCEGWEYDAHDRLLARCSANVTDLNRSMVRDGWAVSFGDYGSEERVASRERAGLWSSEFVEPARWRRDAKEASSGNWWSWLGF